MSDDLVTIWTCEHGRQHLHVRGHTKRCRCVPFTSMKVEWPLWAKLVKRLRHDGERGVGDTVQRIAAKFGGEKFKLWAKSMGLPCGCTERQGRWNALYPYDDGAGPSQDPAPRRGHEG